jgi:hypothetical protein
VEWKIPQKILLLFFSLLDVCLSRILAGRGGGETKKTAFLSPSELTYFD